MIFKSKKITTSSEQTPWEQYQKSHKQSVVKKQKSRLRIRNNLSKITQQKKHQINRRVVSFIVLFGILLLIVSYLVSPLSHIQNIKIVGNRVLTKQQIEQVVEVRRGDSILPVVGRKKQLIALAKKKYPRIQQLSFTVQNFNHLKIKVKEYLTAGYVAYKGKYRVALESGNVINKNLKQPTGDYPVYYKFNSQHTLHKMIVQYSQLPDNLKGEISEIQYLPTKSNSERVHAFMNDGNEVYASLATFSKKMSYYPSIAAKMKTKGIVNLEVGAYSYPFNS